MINQKKLLAFLLAFFILIGNVNVYAYSESEHIASVYDFNSYVNAIKQAILSCSDSVTIQINSYDSSTYDYKKAMETLYNQSPEVCYLYKSSSCSTTSTGHSATQTIDFNYKNSMEDLSQVVQVNNYNDYYLAIQNALQKFQDNVTIKVKNYNSYTYAPSDAINKVLNYGNDARLGYSSASISYYGEGSDKIVKITFEYAFTKDKMLEMKEAINVKTQQIISKVIKPDMKDYEKELALHDYLVNNSRYDISNYNNNTVPKEEHTAYGILVKGTGVCEGYAEAMKKLLTAVGIECIVVTGLGNGGPHAWNMVKIQNQYYMLDPTWDDPVSNKDVLSHNYFNVTDSQLSSNHSWKKNSLPDCNSTDYSYNNILQTLNGKELTPTGGSSDNTSKETNSNQNDTSKNVTPSDNTGSKNQGGKTSNTKLKELRNSVVLFIDDPKAYVKGEKKAIDSDNFEVVPVVLDGNTLVPLRFVTESFGAEVQWDEATSGITIQYGKSKAQLTLDSDIMYVDGKEVKLNVPAQIINNRTMVPLRRLVEDLIKKEIFYEDNLIVIDDDSNISALDKTGISMIRTLFIGNALLKKEDMSFNLDGKTYFFDRPKADDLFNQLGSGNANAGNNYGFVGWANNNQEKIYRNGYPAKNPTVYVYSSLKVKEDSIRITYIDISKTVTNRGIKVGDSYRKMRFIYDAAPYKTEDLGNGRFRCLYGCYGYANLAFYFDAATRNITGISIIFN